MADWTAISLKDAINPDRGISYGIVQPGAHITDGVPIIRVSDIRHGRIDTSSPIRVHPDIESQHRRTRLRGGELLITIVGTVGETVIVPEDLAGWNVARAVSVLSIKPEIGAYWVQLALRSPSVRAMIDSRLNTTVQATLNLGDLAQLPILMPPPDDRERIGSIIEAFDKKIEVNRQMNETLEAMARAIFKDWFIDFGPTRAKMAGTKPYLAPEIWNLFPDNLDDEGKPAGWENGCLADFTDLQNGYAFKSSDWQDDGVPVVKIGSVKPAVVDLTQVSFVSTLLGEDRLAFRLNIGDVLVGLTGYVGETGRIPPTDNPPLLNQRVGRFSTVGRFSPFVYSCVRDPVFKEFAEGMGHGSAQANVSTKDLLTYPVLKPSKEILVRYEDIVGPIYEKSLFNLGEIHTLASTRDLLLPKLMSGEIRVRDGKPMTRAALAEAI